MRTPLNGWMVVLLLGGTMAYALAEELTLTTYYPSPRGVYQELRTSGNVAIGTLNPSSASVRLELIGGGATSATTALRIRNADQTPLVEVLNNGTVGLGTATPNPSARLHVIGSAVIEAGQLRLGNVASDPAAMGNGAIYYNTSTNKFRGYVGGVWQDLGSGGGITLNQGSGMTLAPSPITSTGTISANFNTVQARVTGSCPNGAIRSVNQDGSVTCAPILCTWGSKTYTTNATCYAGYACSCIPSGPFSPSWCTATASQYTCQTNGSWLSSSNWAAGQYGGCPAGPSPVCGQ